MKKASLPPQDQENAAPAATEIVKCRLKKKHSSSKKIAKMAAAEATTTEVAAAAAVKVEEAPPKIAAAATAAAGVMEAKSAPRKKRAARTPAAAAAAAAGGEVATAAAAGEEEAPPQPRQEGHYDEEKHLKEKSDTYCYLWHMVVTLEKKHSLCLKEAFLKIEDAQANLLNSEVKKLYTQQMEQLSLKKKTHMDVLNKLIEMIK